MLALLLKILSILGIILLVLLAIFLLILLLALFFPVTYRVFWEKNTEKMSVSVRVRWLFGLLRLQYAYPAPGNLRLKLLWITLFDTGQERKTPKKAGRGKSTSPPPQGRDSEDSKEGQEDRNDRDGTHENIPEKEEAQKHETEAPRPKSIKCFLLEKYEKIVYTFRHIYDKMKHIWENISCYRALLEDEETVLLFRHIKERGGKIWRIVRPRKLKADLLLGTGSPDTTGYAYGIYGMLSPQLGRHVTVTPDFNQAVFQGNLNAWGYITVFYLLWHGGHLAFDRRLRLFTDKLKAIRTPGNGGKNGR